eukprot:CAMPEP_0113448574 /NCGR_PEP_ID=MMETSP0014_2-20120614/4836_1 /TAXON_ID=2857 /ORGANISM="Nitzschia sp." /LENGTH=461 /DNA_ID=CAMNT_0000339789 /DNA_START=112 /DNA_END=1497 /DNA_ORIENTATION=+ /assembly_acc=CAM_ASM_000159
MDINQSSSSTSCYRQHLHGSESSQGPSQQRRRRGAPPPAAAAAEEEDRKQQQTSGSSSRRNIASRSSGSNRTMVLCLLATATGFILQMVVLSHVSVEASAFGQQQKQQLLLRNTSKTRKSRKDNAHTTTTASLFSISGRKQATQLMMSSIRGGTSGGGGGGSDRGSSSKSRLAVSSLMVPTTAHRRRQENQQQLQQLQDQQQYPPSSSTLTTKMKKHRALLLLAVSIPALLGTMTTRPHFVVNGITSLFASYRNALIERPLTSKVLTGATLAIIGDFVAQYTTWPSSSSSSSTKSPSDIGTGDFAYDKRRAASFAVFDACYRVFQNAMFPAVIGLCEGNIMKQLVPVATTRVAAAIERTMLYQLVIVPTLYYPVFFIFTGFIQGLSLNETLERMKSNYFKCWGRNLQFWIPTQFVLFGMINEHWQIPFACAMGMVWSSILSLTAGSAKPASSATINGKGSN